MGPTAQQMDPQDSATRNQSSHPDHLAQGLGTPPLKPDPRLPPSASPSYLPLKHLQKRIKLPFIAHRGQRSMTRCNHRDVIVTFGDFRQTGVQPFTAMERTADRARE